MLVIDLPLPHKILHPNGRTRSYRWRGAVVRNARDCAGIYGKYHCRETYRAATVHMEFHMPRKRDNDGLIAWVKPYLDGFQDAGIVKNDSAFTIGEVTQVTGKDAGQFVRFRIEERTI